MKQTNIDDLRERIVAKIPKLTKSQKRIANYFLENPQVFALNSVRDLEKELQTSKATIVRLTQALGYSGFQELKAAFLQDMKKELGPIQRYKSKLDKKKESGNTLQDVVEQTHLNLNQTLQLISETDLKKGVRLLYKALNIYTMGLGISYYLADIAAYQFRRVSLNAYQLPFGPQNFSEQLINLSPENLIFAFSFPPYSQETIKAAAYAKERDISVISVTDRPTSQIISYSDLSFQVPVESTIMSNSIMAPMALVYALASQIGHDLKKKVIQTIESIDHVRKEH